MTSIVFSFRVFSANLFSVDIPRLSYDNIQLDSGCFYYTISVSSSSNHSLVTPVVDAKSLEKLIMEKGATNTSVF